MIMTYSRERIAALDIGSHKISLCVGVPEGNRVRLESAVIMPSRGFDNGVVYDLKELTDSIVRALETVQKKTERLIRSVAVNLVGATIDGCCVTGSCGMPVRGKQVTAGDIHRCLAHAKVAYVPIGRQLIHEIPLTFSIDDNDGIVQPLGLYANHLKARFLLISADRMAVHNIVAAVNRAGLDVERFVVNPYASALGVLGRDEPAQSVVVLDFGAGAVDCAIFDRNVLQRIKSVAYSPEGCGCAVEVDRAVIMTRLRPMMQEYCHQVANPKVLVTGGKVLEDGFIEQCEQALQVPVTMAIGRGVDGAPEYLGNPAFATCFGLLRYSLEKPHGDLSFSYPNETLFERIVARFRELYEDYF